MSSAVQTVVKNPLNALGAGLGQATTKLTGSKFAGDVVKWGTNPFGQLAQEGLNKLSSPGELPPPADPGTAPDPNDPAIAAAQARERKARGRNANIFAGKNYGSSPLPSVSRTLLGGS